MSAAPSPSWSRIGTGTWAEYSRDDPLDRRLLGIGLGVVDQLEDDARAARRRRIEGDRLDGEGALAVRGPAPGLVADPAFRDVTSTDEATMKAE